MFSVNFFILIIKRQIYFPFHVFRVLIIFAVNMISDMSLASDFSLFFVHYSSTHWRPQPASYPFFSCYVRSSCPVLSFWFNYAFIIFLVYTTPDRSQASRPFSWRVSFVPSTFTRYTFMSIDEFSSYLLFSGVRLIS